MSQPSASGPSPVLATGCVEELCHLSPHPLFGTVAASPRPGPRGDVLGVTRPWRECREVTSRSAGPAHALS